MGKRKYFFGIIIVTTLLLGSSVFAFWGNGNDTETETGEEQSKSIIFNDNGVIFQISSKAKTVAGLIEEQNISVGEEDNIVPAKETRIYSGSKIIIQRAKKVVIFTDGEEIKKHTYFEKTEDVLADAGIDLSSVDMVRPSRNSFVYDEMEIRITRVNIEEKIVKKDIAFETISKKDDDLGWREKKVKQKGEEGIKEIKYRIIYHNGKEISREILENSIVKEPVNEIVTQGTYVKIGKAHTGFGTWYAHTGTMAAASPWLPMGSYAKVTNKTNGKSVIVKINDRGPFGKNRIIDLDKVAFQKIASLGAGVIDVKVEEVLN